jgi:hypothetical protein
MSGFVGAGDGIRTRDLYLGKVSLYQLSHSRINADDYSIEKEKMQNAAQGGRMRCRTATQVTGILHPDTVLALKITNIPARLSHIKELEYPDVSFY